MSSILDTLLSRVERVADGLSQGWLLRDVVEYHADDIMELQREQLMEGKASSGDDIRPYYSEDLKPGGHFYSVESAKRYADWKLDITPSRSRNPDAPNLYINGKFHDELGVDFGADEMVIRGMTGYADGIVAKYGLSTFGLTAENWNTIWTERGGYEELMKEIRTILYD